MKTSIIVTVKSADDGAGKPFNYDIEIPVGVPFAKLGIDIRGLISQERGDAAYYSLKGELYCERLHRQMLDAETPSQAGIWNGDIFRIR